MRSGATPSTATIAAFQQASEGQPEDETRQRADVLSGGSC